MTFSIHLRLCEWCNCMKPFKSKKGLFCERCRIVEKASKKKLFERRKQVTGKDTK